MNIVLTDSRVSDKCLKGLDVLNFVVVRLPSFRRLSAPVASHPDMTAALFPDGSLLIHADYYNENRELFDKLGINIITTDEKMTPLYPEDVLFDALAVDGTLYGKNGAVSEKLIKSHNKFVSVRQGYTRCSVALLSDSCAVTADAGIAGALIKNGLKVLKIRPGYIELPGCNFGFIGGAGGRLSEGMYCFFGDLMSHPDGADIAGFAAENKISTVSLSDEPLFDYGGLIVIRK